ncbi:MAG: hypothetical protein AAGM22_27910 [Acidobacteriota bacterium]
MLGPIWPGLVLALVLQTSAPAPQDSDVGTVQASAIAAKVGDALTLAAGAALPHSRSTSAGNLFEVEGGIQTSPAPQRASFGLGYAVTGGLRAVVQPDAPMLFGDDFETGDTSAWSETVIFP